MDWTYIALNRGIGGEMDRAACEAAKKEPSRHYSNSARWRMFAAVIALALIGFTTDSPGQTSVESLERPGGQPIQGWLEGDVRSGFRFRTREPGTSVSRM